MLDQTHTHTHNTLSSLARYKNRHSRIRATCARDNCTGGSTTSCGLLVWVLLVWRKGFYRMVINVIVGSVDGVEREEQMTRAFLTQFGGHR